jgi:hypothetical protein
LFRIITAREASWPGHRNRRMGKLSLSAKSVVEVVLGGRLTMCLGAFPLDKAAVTYLRIAQQGGRWEDGRCQPADRKTRLQGELKNWKIKSVRRMSQ